MKAAGVAPASTEAANRDAKRIKELEAQLREARKQLAEKEDTITILKKSVGILSTP